jgi:trans-2-enoyl-CoA reductase
MDLTDEKQNKAAGLARLEALSASLDAAALDAVSRLEHAPRISEQPWLLAGVSDGMGLHTTLAAIDSGLLRYGVGVYYEPPALIELDDDGQPVSPVHFARYQNALALEEYARKRGVDFQVLFADIMMAPRRGLKGDVREEAPDFPDEVRKAFEAARSRAPREDAVFIDSVAFGKWICPREGRDPIEAPSIDFEGRVIATRTKGFHARGYEETLDTMGRNHAKLLEAMVDFGWLGPAALTAFFTWAGGSQNVEALAGVYGRGALGDAKIIAERDVAAFRLTHGLEHGAHAIVRLPAFLSAALMAIPGAGLFGLLSRKVLAEHGVYRDMPELSVMMLDKLFGPAWVRENPISQIELDTAEILHMDEISQAVDEAHRRVAEFRAQQPEDARSEPIPLAKSKELLEGLVPEDYTEILRRFRPELGAPEGTKTPAPA